MALSGIQIYKMLPQTNCKECGFPTCLAFSMKLAAKQVELDDCPYVTDESKQQLAESAAPPIRLITLKAKDREVAVGNEVVLFRHEKKFFNRPGVLIRVVDTDEHEAITKKVEAATAYTVDYVGLDLKLDGFAVEAASGDAATFAAAVGAVRKSSGLPLILVGDDPAVIEAGLKHSMERSRSSWAPTLRTGRRWPPSPSKAETALGVTAGTLEELAELTEKIQGKGVEDLVLHPTAGGMGASLALQTQIRRLALKNFRPLGYPTIAFAATAGTRRRRPPWRLIRSASTPAWW